MAVVTVRALPDLLDRLAVVLGRQVQFRVRRLAPGELEVEMAGAAWPLARLRVEAALRKIAPAAQVKLS